MFNEYGTSSHSRAAGFLPQTAWHVQRKARRKSKSNPKLGLSLGQRTSNKKPIFEELESWAAESEESKEDRADERELESRETLAAILSGNSPFRDGES